jgi:hypothetical protein
MVRTKCAVWVGAAMMVACAARMKVDEGGAAGGGAAAGAGGAVAAAGSHNPAGGSEGQSIPDTPAVGGDAGSEGQSIPATPVVGGQGGGEGQSIPDTLAVGGDAGSEGRSIPATPFVGGQGGGGPEAPGTGAGANVAGAGGDGVPSYCYEDYLGSDRTGRPGSGLTSNAPGCPSKPPDHAGVCATDTDEGLVCAYLGSDEQTDYYTECQCVATSRTELEWDCYVRSSGDFESCPETAPHDGDPCDGSLLCDFPPRVECFCDGGRTWSCTQASRSELPEPTPDVSASLPVSQLSTGEIAAWCNWYIDVMYDGHETQETLVVDDDGFVQAMPQNCLGPATNAFLPRLTAALCERNMALSTCDAPVSELSDCALTFANQCVPAPTGCRRYLDTPGCDGTMIIDNGGCYRMDVSVTGVPVKVEATDTNVFTAPAGTGLDSNPGNCPHEPVAPESLCEDEGLVCGYVEEGDIYAECACLPTGPTELAWYCYPTAAPYSDSCPSAPPEIGTACEAEGDGSECPYPPRRVYVCGDDDTWQLRASGAWDGPDLPASPAPTTRVADLSDTDRTAWCNWLVSATRGSDEAVEAIDDNGFVNVAPYGQSYCGSPVTDAVLPFLPAIQCEQNLALSSCEAPVSELSDCVITLLSSCAPSPTGCRRYLETPGCFATVVVDFEGVDDTTERLDNLLLRVRAPQTTETASGG